MVPTAKMRAASTAAPQRHAAARDDDVAPAIEALQEAGAASLRAIAAGLTDQGSLQPAARASGQRCRFQWVLERL